MPQLGALEGGLANRGSDAFVSRWWPRAAMFGGLAAVFYGTFPQVPDRHLQAWGFLIAFMTFVFDSLRGRRDFEGEMAKRSLRDLRGLVTRIPIEYEVGCRTKHPDAVAAEILKMIDERLKRLGETTFKDL
jgi:hypothetical protein